MVIPLYTDTVALFKRSSVHSIFQGQSDRRYVKKNIKKRCREINRA